MNESRNSSILSIDGKYDFEIEGVGAGVGELRLTEFLQAMLGLTKRFASLEVRKSSSRQLEIVLAAVGVTREFLRHAVPGTDIEAPLTHLMTALISTAEGHKVPLFAIPETRHGRDFARVMVEVKSSASIDALHGPPVGLSLKEAAAHVAQTLEDNGLNFFSRSDVPAFKQVLEWRKRLRKAKKGTDEWEGYHAAKASIRAAMQAHPTQDPIEGITQQLEWLLAGVVSPAHLNRDADPIA